MQKRNPKSFVLQYCLVSAILLLLPFCLYGQKNIPLQLTEVLVAKDKNAAEELLKQITKAEVSQMADSTLFDYLYIKAWVASENNCLEESVGYLAHAKDFCETKLGIQNNLFAYFEILEALGDMCEQLGNDDEALLWYEEGLVKGLTFLNANDETLQLYFKGMRDNAARLYEQQGQWGMAQFLRSEKPLDYEDTFDYACDLCNRALQLDGEGKSGEAIKLLDTAEKIFQRSGADGEEMMQPLHRIYLGCFASIGDTKQIDRLLRAKKRIMFAGENGGSYLVEDLGNVIAKFVNVHHDIKTAEKYYQYIIREQEGLSQSEWAVINELRGTLDVFGQIYSRIDSLEQVISQSPIKDYEWGINSLQLANLMMEIQRYEDGNRICEEIYSVSSQLREDPNHLHWAVLMNLADYCILQKDYPNAERYLNEQLAWLENQNISNNPEEGWIYNKMGIVCMNSGRYDESKELFDKAEMLLLPLFGKKSDEYATLLHNRGHLAQLQGFFEDAKTLLTEAKRIQILVSGKAMERTIQYLNEVEQAIKVSL